MDGGVRVCMYMAAICIKTRMMSKSMVEIIDYWGCELQKNIRLWWPYQLTYVQ